ncbi:MAG TPA: amidase family protein, partial [Vicinamibacterales bacterium]|nr:amidase family protein [Vicinamibacterales bacterium]
MTAATAVDIRDAVRAGRQSAREVCQQALDRISAVESQLHAFNTVVAERALERAAAVDRERDRWRDAPLLGVPVALKDNLCTRDVRTTASSKILEQYVPPYDATAVARLEAAGAIVVGKTNCDE